MQCIMQYIVYPSTALPRPGHIRAESGSDLSPGISSIKADGTMSGGLGTVVSNEGGHTIGLRANAQACFLSCLCIQYGHPTVGAASMTSLAISCLPISCHLLPRPEFQARSNHSLVGT